MKNKFAGIFLIVGLLSGCTFGVDSSATPQNVYKKAMKYYRQNYAYIHEAPQIPLYWPIVAVLDDTDKGWKKLAEIFTEFEDLHKDGHIAFEHGRDDVERQYVSSWDVPPTPEERVSIIGNIFAYQYGQVKNKPEIGYILVKELSTNISALDRINDKQEWLKKIDPIIDTLKSRGVEKIILDIRSHAGGSQSNGEFIISRFMNRTAAYMVSYDLIGLADDKSSYKRKVIHIGPNSSGVRFSGPVVLLIDANTGSGGEVFALAARQIPGIKTIGQNTGGLPGTITVYDLPNHWTLQLTTSKTFPIKPDGSDGDTYLTVGIKPDILVKNMENTRKDEILDRGIKEISEM